MKSTKEQRRTISLGNWVITLILGVIPGINILFWIGSSLFARNSNKRTFAAAALLLYVIFLLLIVLGVVIFANDIYTWSEKAVARYGDIITDGFSWDKVFGTEPDAQPDRQAPVIDPITDPLPAL